MSSNYTYDCFHRPDLAAIQAELKTFQIEHKWDPNLPAEDRVAVEEALVVDDIEKKAAVEVHLLEEDSPYPEVRAAVRNYDEDVPANTLRVGYPPPDFWGGKY